MAMWDADLTTRMGAQTAARTGAIAAFVFAGLGLQAPQLPASPSLIPDPEPEDDAVTSQHHLARLAEEVAKRLNQVSGHSGGVSAGGGIAPETQAWAA